MKKLFLLLLCALFIVAGCTEKKPPVQIGNDKPKTDHLISEQDGVTVEVSNELKTFPKSMISTKEGYDVVGVSVIVVNKTKDNLPISPDFVTLVSMDGTEYKYSEITSITGKGAFKSVALPPEYRGGGLMLFEIKKDVKISKVLYKDDQGHEITILYESGVSSQV